MGLFPEPAHRADDACRLVPNETLDRDETVAWLKPGSLHGRKKASTTVSAKLTVAKDRDRPAARLGTAAERTGAGSDRP